MLKRTIYFIFLLCSLNIGLFSQSECFNLKFANNSWHRKDSIVSVAQNNSNMSIRINNKYIKVSESISHYLDIKVNDILGRTLTHSYNIFQNNLTLNIENDLHSERLVFITIIYRKNNLIKSTTIKTIIY
ncbi:MAG TPA: hypothetical protein PLE30_08220 [Candidatus Kapabacteria bacterium]|nr:hypothetical protein [Candidatus Kapabacteria bacterium]